MESGSIPWFVLPMCVLHIIALTYKLLGITPWKIIDPFRRLLMYTQLAFMMATMYWVIYYLEGDHCVRETMYQLAFLMSLIVTLVFWTLYLRGGSNIYNVANADALMPFWMKVFAHGGIWVLLIIDLWLTPHDVCFSFTEDCAIFALLSVVLGAMLAIHKSVYGIYLYGFFDKMNLFQQAVFFVVMWVFVVIMDLIYRNYIVTAFHTHITF